MKSAVIIILTGVILLSGCTGKVREKEKIDFDIVSSGFYSKFHEKAFIVINNKEDFAELLKKSGLRLSAPDFNRYTVIALFMGEKRTGGYKIEVEKIVRDEGVVKVYVRNTIPSSTCIVTQQITSPYQIIKIEKIEGKIEFVESTEEMKC